MIKILTKFLNKKSIFFWLLVTVIIKQFLWIVFIPMWQFPDEQAHFGQVQNTAEGHAINPAHSNNTTREIDESEILLDTKRDDFGNNKFTYHPEYNIAYSSIKVGIHEPAIADFPDSYRNQFVSNEATAYPPLYYRLTAMFYKLAYTQNLLTRLFVSRLINLGLFLALIFKAFKTGKIIFPEDKLLRYMLIIFVAFHPMLSFLSGGINSDNLFC